MLGSSVFSLDNFLCTPFESCRGIWFVALQALTELPQRSCRRTHTMSCSRFSPNPIHSTPHLTAIEDDIFKIRERGLGKGAWAIWLSCMWTCWAFGQSVSSVRKTATGNCLDYSKLLMHNGICTCIAPNFQATYVLTGRKVRSSKITSTMWLLDRDKAVLSESEITPYVLQVFWDMENCRFNNARPVPDMSLEDWSPRKIMSPQEHYDLLARVFITWCGVKPEDFRVHAVMARETVKEPGGDAEIQTRVTLHSPTGSFNHSESSLHTLSKLLLLLILILQLTSLGQHIIPQHRGTTWKREKSYSQPRH